MRLYSDFNPNDRDVAEFCANYAKRIMDGLTEFSFLIAHPDAHAHAVKAVAEIEALLDIICPDRDVK